MFVQEFAAREIVRIEVGVERMYLFGFSFRLVGVAPFVLAISRHYEISVLREIR